LLDTHGDSTRGNRSQDVQQNVVDVAPSHRMEELSRLAGDSESQGHQRDPAQADGWPTKPQKKAERREQGQVDEQQLWSRGEHVDDQDQV